MRRALPIAVGLLFAAGLGWWCLHRPQPEPVNRASDDEPSITFTSPYLNVRPEVKYVGDEACGQCHASEAESYRHHSMGRAFAPVAAVASPSHSDQPTHNSFEKFGFQFLIDRQGERVFHRELRKDAQGQVVAELDVEVQWVLGSGSRGHSYLLNREGRLFQSPISWYSQKQAWDISPGFAASRHAGRPITPECLYCHCNRVDPVPQTINQYREPIFRGYAIGCERCHGPGGLHVAARQQGELQDGEDYTIVNPAHLPPALREAVCQQCHLLGDGARILRRGREVFDFRPGLPLHHFWSIFVRRPGFNDKGKAVGQVQQMYSSRCFRDSRGKLGCISCHDPHALPAADQKAAYYRSRCLQCHQPTSCGLTIAQRREKSPADDCLTCHMRRFDSSNIAHTALTDHRILRTPDAIQPAPPFELRPGDSPVLHFHQDILDLPQAERDRDLGVACVELARGNPGSWPLLFALAGPLLESAVRAHPDDVLALESQAALFSSQGRYDLALASYESVLARFPKWENSLAEAALVAEAIGRKQEAVAYWRRALAVDPWTARHHYGLAALLADRRDWSEAVKECEAFLRLNPFSIETRTLLVSCLARSGDRERARTEFGKLLACSPAEQKVALENWFSEQMP